MNGGIQQKARIDAAVVRGKFTDLLPPRNVEHEATQAWLAVDRLSTADAKDIRENIRAIVEMQERLEAMIERAAL